LTFFLLKKRALKWLLKTLRSTVETSETNVIVMVVYLVSPNIPNKMFSYLVYLVSLLLWFYDRTVKMKLNKVLFVYRL